MLMPPSVWRVEILGGNILRFLGTVPIVHFIPLEVQERILLSISLTKYINTAEKYYGILLSDPFNISASSNELKIGFTIMFKSSEYSKRFFEEIVKKG